MKKWMLLVVMLLLTGAVTAGCSPSPHAEKEEISSGFLASSGFSKVKTVTDYDALYQAFQKEPTYEEWKTQFPVEYERCVNNSQAALYQTDEGWVLLKVEADGGIGMLEKISISDEISEETLDQIEIGTTLEQVMELDPNANYPFLYASWDKYPKISYHYTKEGLRYTIFYDDEYCVTEVNKEIF